MNFPPQRKGDLKESRQPWIADAIIETVGEGKREKTGKCIIFFFNLLLFFKFASL